MNTTTLRLSIFFKACYVETVFKKHRVIGGLHEIVLDQPFKKLILLYDTWRNLWENASQIVMCSCEYQQTRADITKRGKERYYEFVE